MRRSIQRQVLALLLPLVAGVVSGCDGAFFAEPAPAPTAIEIRLGTAPAAGTAAVMFGGVDQAFDAVDGARVRVAPAGGGGIDETVQADRVDGTIRLEVVLDLDDPEVSAELELELRAGNAPLFRTSEQVALERGTRNVIELDPEPVPFGLSLPPPPPAFEALGDSLVLGGAVVFATGDTIPQFIPAWRTLDSGVVAVEESNVAVATGAGTTDLEASFGTLSQTWSVRVEPVIVSVAIIPNQVELGPGQGTVLEADLRDRRGNRILTHPVDWSSENPSIVSVDAEGSILAHAPGSTRILARASGSQGTADVVVRVVEPEVETLAPADVGEDSAVLRARVRPMGATTAVTFRYGTDPDLSEGTTVSAGSVEAGVDETVVTFEVTNLTPSTTWYVRAEGTNEAGSGTGETLTFATDEAAVETVIVTPAELQLAPGVSTTLQVELRDRRGTVLSPRPAEWRSENPSIATVDDGGTVQGIAEGSTRVIATVEGVEGSSDVQIILLPPIVETLDPSQIFERQARLDARVTPRTAPTQVVFRWGLNQTLTNASVTSPVSLAPSPEATVVRFTLFSLTPDRTYYYRAEATNAAGTVVGEIRSFRTLQELPAPTITNLYDDGGVWVYWDYPQDLLDQVYFELERGVMEADDPPSTWSLIATLEATFYNDHDAERGETNAYRVRACAEGLKCSPYSNIGSTFVWDFQQAAEERSTVELFPYHPGPSTAETSLREPDLPAPAPACRGGAPALFCARVDSSPPN